MKSYIALITILFFTLIGLTIAVSAGYLGIGSSQMAVDKIYEEKAKWLATMCAEDVLRKLKTEFTEYDDYTLGSGEEICNVTATGSEKTQKTVQSQGRFKNKYQRLELDVLSDPSFFVNSWQEVTFFP